MREYPHTSRKELAKIIGITEDGIKKHMNNSSNHDITLQGFVNDIKQIINTARTNAVRSVDFCRVQMYWTIGQRIVEKEQQGKERADYGTYLIKNLAKEIEPEFGSGFGERQLERCKERIPESPQEIIKDPMVLEFLGLERKASYYEKDLESAIISHIADFLLEMGKGFSFVARQKRLLIEDDEYFADLVFYNRLLRSFVVIEIKNHKLTHQDLGQLQLYVNYYDRYEKTADENPTIGILLCTDKNDTAVRLALPEDNKTILASKYQLYLPTTEQLITEINEVKKLTERR